ncbi:MAG: heme ABC transporter ATP-binding protein [Myxococcales bacterium]|nr:heme ABC transporter ATP-binding protein [Myxococcales bacterium]|tara:strand:+ start:1228 stop:2037 length:810 start_codon:yes stop_codon:yes gene_type:complete
MSINVSDLVIKRGGRTIIDTISFRVDAGEFLAIAGVNGSGKSTVLGGLSGELPLAAGTIKIDGVSLFDWPLDALATRRAVLLQDSDLSFPFTVLDVVLMGRTANNHGVEKPRDIEIAASALEKTGLAGFENRRYTNLSGGERQRVHLSRVLAQVWPDEANTQSIDQSTTKYLFLDEPTASQDLAAQHMVLSCARAFADGGGVVVSVLHDLNQVAQYADRVLLLSGAQVAAYGVPKAVLTPEVLEPVYGVEVRVLDDPSMPYPLVVSCRQ